MRETREDNIREKTGGSVFPDEAIYAGGRCVIEAQERVIHGGVQTTCPASLSVVAYAEEKEVLEEGDGRMYTRTRHTQLDSTRLERAVSHWTNISTTAVIDSIIDRYTLYSKPNRLPTRSFKPP